MNKLIVSVAMLLSLSSFGKLVELTDEQLDQVSISRIEAFEDQNLNDFTNQVISLIELRNELLVREADLVSDVTLEQRENLISSDYLISRLKFFLFKFGVNISDIEVYGEHHNGALTLSLQDNILGTSGEYLLPDQIDRIIINSVTFGQGTQSIGSIQIMGLNIEGQINISFNN